MSQQQQHYGGKDQFAKCEDGSDNWATDDVEEMQDFVVVQRAKRKKLSQQQQ